LIAPRGAALTAYIKMLHNAQIVHGVRFEVFTTVKIQLDVTIQGEFKLLVHSHEPQLTATKFPK